MKKPPTERDSFPEADALLDAAACEDDARQTSNRLGEAFRWYREGRITSDEYDEISQRLGYREQLAKAAAAAVERVNNQRATTYSHTATIGSFWSTAKVGSRSVDRKTSPSPVPQKRVVTGF